MGNVKWSKNFKNKSPEEFKNFIIEHNNLFNLHLENIENLNYIANKMSSIFLNVNSFGINQIRSSFSNLSKEFNTKARNDLHKSYYLFRGYNEDYAISTISNLQKRRSKRCKEFWMNKGYSEEESMQKVSEIQQNIGKKLVEKLRYDDKFKREFSVWSIDHWIKRGYSKEDAKEKIKQYNPSCKEFYDTSEAYKLGKLKNSERIKKLWERGVYDDKIKLIQTRYTSKQEKIFFSSLKEALGRKLIYEPFGINVRTHSEDYYYVYDAYYKSSKGIILFEYDGTYWHNIEKDEKRDKLVLSLRNDIIGIIRTNDFYYYKHNINKKDIQNAITKIESKESNRILLYESA